MPLVRNGYSTYLEQDTAVNTKHIYHQVSVAGVRKPLGNQNVPHHREQSLTQIKGILFYTGWFRRKCQYFSRWQYRSLWEKQFIRNICVILNGYRYGAVWTHKHKSTLNGTARLKRDGTRAETIFRLSGKRTRPLKSAGWRQFSRLLSAEVCASAVVMLDTPCSEVVWRVLATHSIQQFPLHFPTRASPCAITFQLDSTGPTAPRWIPDGS